MTNLARFLDNKVSQQVWQHKCPPEPSSFGSSPTMVTSLYERKFSYKTYMYNVDQSINFQCWIWIEQSCALPVDNTAGYPPGKPCVCGAATWPLLPDWMVSFCAASGGSSTAGCQSEPASQPTGTGITGCT